MRFEESTLTLRVRPNDLDSLGHVNHAAALEYLEAGRWAWMDRNGLRVGTGVVPVVTRVEVDYRREVRLQDVVVRTALEVPADGGLDEDAVTYRAAFRQTVLVDGERQVAVEATVRVAFLDAASRALCSLQDFLAASRTHATSDGGGSPP